MKTTILLITAVLSFNIALSQKVGTYNQVLTKQVKGQIDVYKSKNGEEFKVGDTLTLGSAFRNEYFDYIRTNAGFEIYMLPNTASGSVVRIKKIHAKAKQITLSTTRPQGFVYGLYVINLEGALTNGEIESNTLSSDDALEDLGRAHKKMQLGLISKEEYEAKKEELKPFID